MFIGPKCRTGGSENRVLEWTPEKARLQYQPFSATVSINMWNSRADLDKNCAFCDKSMKLGTWFLDILRSILRNGATSDLTFGDL